MKDEVAQTMRNKYFAPVGQLDFERDIPRYNNWATDVMALMRKKSDTNTYKDVMIITMIR